MRFLVRLFAEQFFVGQQQALVGDRGLIDARIGIRRRTHFFSPAFSAGAGAADFSFSFFSACFSTAAFASLPCEVAGTGFSSFFPEGVSCAGTAGLTTGRASG